MAITSPSAPHASVLDIVQTAPVGIGQTIVASAAPMPVVADSFAIPAPSAPSAAVPALGVVPDAPAAVNSDSAQQSALIGMINRERLARGEQPLTQDPLLTSVARAHSEDMCVRGYFDHYAPGPGPVTPMDRYIAALGERPDYATVGENIYYRSATDSALEYAAEAHEAFMNSPGHRANILMPQYTKVGVGIYVDQLSGEFWVTEMFLDDQQP